MLCMYKTWGSAHLPAIECWPHLRVQANLWPKMSWLGDVVRLWLEHPHVLGPYCQQLCCGWVQPPCRGFGKADFSPRVFHRPGSKSASSARRCGCPRLQERHPGAGASRVSPGEARLLRRPVGNRKPFGRANPYQHSVG